jgi:hypothetical protein
VHVITLKYWKSGTAYSKVFNALSVKGLDDPDKVQLVAWQYPIVDGSLRDHIKGFRKVITTDLGVVALAEDRRFVIEFLAAETKQAQLGSVLPFVVLGEPAGYENQWLWDSALGRSFLLELAENRIRTTWESLLPWDNMIGYTKYKVKVIGTQAVPEKFTTNSGKLEHNYDTTHFPEMSLVLYIISVKLTPYQDGKINQVGDIVQNGTDIDFYLAISDVGNASSDGFFYADITVTMQEIV